MSKTSLAWISKPVTESGIVNVLGLLQSASAPVPKGAVAPEGAKSGPKRKRLHRPWDQGELRERLQTFRPTFWFARPAPANAKECATQGWECTGLDEITCTCCQQKLRYILGPEELEDQHASDFAVLLNSAHLPFCIWRDNPWTCLMWSNPDESEVSKEKQLEPDRALDRVKDIF